MADFWDSEKELGTIQKNKTETIFIKDVAMRDKHYIDIRVFYTDKASGELKPGKGITIPADKLGELQDILNGINTDEGDVPY